MNLDGAISKLTSFNKRQFITEEELFNYASAFINDNNITDIELIMNINPKLGNKSYAAFHCSNNQIDFNISEIIYDYMKDCLNVKCKKSIFHKVTDPSEFIDKYDLSDEEILLCNLKIMENLNHELFHVLAFFNVLNYANGKDYILHPEVIHNIAKSNMNQTLDSTLSEPLYQEKHDVFYEEFLAITHGYKWTYEIIDSLKLDTSYIELFNQDTFKRISNVFNELQSDNGIYRNHNYDSSGELDFEPENLIDLNYNYGTNFIPACIDMKKLPVRKQVKILKDNHKKENYYLKGLDKFSIMIYMLNKQVYENTKGACMDYTEYESLLYGYIYKDSPIADMFNGRMDNDLLEGNLFRRLDTTTKTKTF